MLLNKLTEVLRSRVVRVGLPAAGLVLLTGLLGCGEEPGVFAEEDVAWSRVAEPAATGGKLNRETYKTFTLIGRKGGTFSFRKLTVKFPPKAVDGRYEVRIKQADPQVAIWDLSIEPEWRPFNKPVRLSIDYSSFSTSETHSLLWFDEEAGVWVDLGGFDDHGNKTIWVDLSHFSRYGVADGTGGWDGTSGWD
jgi:hypothetical protein